MRPYLVVGTPRSRTAWLAAFLSMPGRPCVHEPSLRFTDPADLERFLTDDAAASDCMMTFLCGRARAIRPDCWIVVVRRPLADVQSSFTRLGLVVQADFLAMLDRKAELVSRDLADLAIDYAALEGEETCREVFETCTGEAFDRGRWAWLRENNIQSDTQATLRLITENFAAHARVFGPHYD